MDLVLVEWPNLIFPLINLYSVWHMEPKDKILTERYKGFTHTKCEFYPCHKGIEREFNCLFCNCPLYWLECPGTYSVIIDADGIKRKDCSLCILPHNGYKQSWGLMNLSKWQKNPKPWKGE